MAAYAATVTSSLRKPIKIGDSMVIFHGQINLTNYNSTLAEITALTGKFRADPVVIVEGISESGFGCHGDPTSKAVKAFNFDQNNATDGPAIEVANDTDVGLVFFTAFGLV